MRRAPDGCSLGASIGHDEVRSPVICHPPLRPPARLLSPWPICFSDRFSEARSASESVSVWPSGVWEMISSINGPIASGGGYLLVIGGLYLSGARRRRHRIGGLVLTLAGVALVLRGAGL